MAMLSLEVLAAIVDGLAMAVLVFRRHRLIYANAAAQALVSASSPNGHLAIEATGLL